MDRCVQSQNTLAQFGNSSAIMNDVNGGDETKPYRKACRWKLINKTVRTTGIPKQVKFAPLIHEKYKNEIYNGLKGKNSIPKDPFSY